MLTGTACDADRQGIGRTEDRVPLSEHEQRQFDAIERALYADDPKFANKVRVADPKTQGRRGLVTGIVLVLFGVAVLVVGAVLTLAYVGVLGFLIMLVGATRAYTGFKRLAGTPTGRSTPGRRRPGGPQRRRTDSEGDPFASGRPNRAPHIARPPQPGRPARGQNKRPPRNRRGDRQGFRELFEERWRRRFDGPGY